MVFLEQHYGDGSAGIYPPDQSTGLMDVWFQTCQPQERDCEGAVRVTDDCRITDSGGTPLDDEVSRERVLRCTLSSG